jgi:hypothetical protein
MMNSRVTSPVLLVLFIAMLVLGRGPVEAQPPAAIAPEAPADREVLARGPIHEAFAEPTAAETTTPPVVSKEPPAPIDEKVPEKKPSNGDFSWIPGYWSWDEESKDFIWTSGVWRIAPPGRSWTPGSWHKVEDGWQWSPGYWEVEDKEETEYLAAPPPSKEAGPAYAAGNAMESYAAGNYVYANGSGYKWQNGFWVSYHSGWVWINAHYRRTPAGYIFVSGYWDMPLLSRGLIYAPVKFNVVGRRIVYQPAYVIEPDFLMGALFVKKGTRTYYFGNWFDPAYTGNYITWVQYMQGSRKRFLDANFKYYRVTTVAMNMSNWERRLQLLYDRRAKGLLARPPISLDQQKRALSRLAEGTETTPVSREVNLSHLKSIRAMRNGATAKGFEITYLSSLAVPKPGAEVTYPIREVEKLEVLSPRERRQIEQQLLRYRNLARERANAESRHSLTSNRRSAAPLVHKRDLPPGTPPERKFDPPPVAKGGGDRKGGVDRSRRGAAGFNRRHGPPPAPPIRRKR